MGACLWLAHTLFDYASMLLRRGNGDDRARALGYLDTAIKDATASGLKSLGDKAIALRASLAVLPAASPTPEPPRSAETDSSKILSKEGEVCRLEWAGKTSRLKDSKGLAYISHLLPYPGQHFHVPHLLPPLSSPSHP